MTIDQRDAVFFDGACGLCRRSSRILRWLNWRQRLRIVDMSTVSPEQLPVDTAVAMQGMPLQTHDGRILIGFPAMRRALTRTPLGAPVGWCLWIPGISFLGRKVYAWVAQNRRRDACAVSPNTQAI